LVFARFRQWDNPNFETIGEAVNFFEQIFEVQFLPFAILIAITKSKICLGTCVHASTRPCTPVRCLLAYAPPITHACFTVTLISELALSTAELMFQRPPRYYFIDFGLSEYHDQTAGACVTDFRFGGDHSCPEEAGTGLFDPFPVDVYYLGNVLREHFVEVRLQWSFFRIHQLTRFDANRTRKALSSLPP
jgi:hypothetical protein